jgi:hypothetical protein
MSQYRAHPEVVELDARIVPAAVKGHVLVHPAASSAVLHSAAAPHPLLTQAPLSLSPPLSLSGTGSGTVAFSPARLRGGGTLFVLHGTGNLSALGAVSVSGGVALFANGTASGQLIFTNGSNSVTLQMTANNQSGTLSYQVISSSVPGVTGQGTLQLIFSGGGFGVTI